MTTIPSNGEKRWQCVSGFREGAEDRNEAHAILQSTLTACLQMPVGITPEKAAERLYPKMYHTFTRWELQTPVPSSA